MNASARYVRELVLPAAMQLLPARMDSLEARAMLMAIGLQESRFLHRRQVGGPARGFWQFEAGGGVRGVLEHQATRPLVGPILQLLRYEPHEVYDALADNDVLAAVFARLLLWTHPGPLPRDATGAWGYYLAIWRPGKPHRETWDALYAEAWEA